jgi:LacI family sucrose operon transcriptional repressor
VTIGDVARLAGVSKTTVSLIINGKSRSCRIRSATERRVLAIIKAEGYVPSRYARGLRSRRTQTIGLVAPDLVNPFFARLNQALEQVARRAGHQLLVGCSEDDPALEREVVANLVSHQIDGLIVASVLDESGLRSRRAACVIPTVYVDREIAVGNASSVASENLEGACEAVSFLLRQGAGEIAYLGGPRSLSTSRHRFAGYRRALAEHRMRFDTQLVAHGDWAPESGREMMTRVMARRGGLPQAVFTASYTLLEGALAAVTESCGRVPEELRIATFDDHPLLDFLPGRITSVRQDTTRLADEAFQMLMRALSGERAVEHRRVPTILVRR